MAITQLHQQRLQDQTNAQSMARQAIMNGNFDVWQRGVTSALTDITVTHLADRWADLPSRDTGTLPTITRTRETLTAGALDNSYYFSRLTTSGAGSSFGANAIHLYWNKIEHGTRLLCGASKKVTVSFWARSSISNKKLGLYLTQDYGTGGSPTSAEAITGTNWTLTSSWVKYTFTFTTNTLVGKTFGTNNNDFLQPSFVPMWGSAYAPIVGTISAETYVGSGTIDIAQVQLCAGDEALPFQPKSYSNEINDCLRYCYQLTDLGDVASGSYVNTTAFQAVIHFPVRMRINPVDLETSSVTGSNFQVGVNNNVYDITSMALQNTTPMTAKIACVTTALTIGWGGFLRITAGNYLRITAEL
jgi:hypothetical protein